MNRRDFARLMLSTTVCALAPKILVNAADKVPAGQTPADNGLIFYPHPLKDEWVLFVLGADGKQTRTIPLRSFGELADWRRRGGTYEWNGELLARHRVAVSGDGKRLACLDINSDDLVISNADGSALTALKLFKETDTTRTVPHSSVLNHDGSMIAYIASTSPKDEESTVEGKLELAIVDDKGVSVQSLVEACKSLGSSVHKLCFSRGGKALFVGVEGNKMYRLAIATGVVTKLKWNPKFRTSDFDIGPNDQILFPSLSQRNKEYKWLYTADSDGSNVRRLLFPDGEYTMPVWSPNGNQIAFVEAIRTGTYAIPDRDYAIYTANLDGSNIRELRSRSELGDLEPGSLYWR